MNLTFDVSQLGNPDLNASNVWVTFAGNSSTMVYNPNGASETINFSNNLINYGGTNYGTSKSYLLSDIATNGLRIDVAQSITGFISYGSTTGITQKNSGTQPDPLSQTTARYSNFEFTYTGGNTGGANLTNITQFGGSLRMDFLAGSTTQSYVRNKLNTGDTFRALAATSNNQTASTFSNSGNFVRVIGPNKFPASMNGVTYQNPYHSFEPYLQNLTNTYGSNASSNLTNLAPGASPGGTGATGVSSTSNATAVNPNATYNLDYHFGSVTTAGTGGNGTSLVLSGYVNATPTGGGTTTVYNNLSITIYGDNPSSSGDTALSMTNFLYQQNLASANVAAQFSGWDAINNDFGAANVSAAVQQKAANDFSQGILDGFVGSTYNTGNGTLGSLSSKEWWSMGTTLTGSVAQPTNSDFYSAWANVVNGNSDGDNGGYFSRGGVYGSPYDDRFNLNTISPNASTTEMRITLLADGTLAVPEPSSMLLLLLGSPAAFWIARRQKTRAKK